MVLGQELQSGGGGVGLAKQEIPVAVLKEDLQPAFGERGRVFGQGLRGRGERIIPDPVLKQVAQDVQRFG